MEETAEVSALESTLLRLALADDDKLENVLATNLPAVIEKLQSPHTGTRNKAVEVLSHVHKRVKGRPAIPLPLDRLLHTFQQASSSSSSSPLVANFALIYVQMAFERSSPEQKLRVTGRLLCGVSGRPAQQRDILLRLAAQGLEPLAGGNGAPAGGAGEWSGKADPETWRGRFPFLDHASDRAVLLQFAARLLLCQPRAQGQTSVHSAPQGVRNELLEAHLQLQAQNRLIDSSQGAIAAPTPTGGSLGDAAAAAAAAAPAPAPPGLSRADVARVEGPGGPPPAAVLATRKLAMLALTKVAEVAPVEVLPHYLIASCDPSEQVSRMGEELLRKRCAVDTLRPPVDLEDAALIRRLMGLFHGTGAKAQGVKPEDRVSPASPALRLRLMGLFTRSIAAANCFPQTLATVFECVYGAGASARLKQSGMEYAVWVFKHARREQLQPMGPIILGGLLRLLDEEQGEGGAGGGAMMAPVQMSIRAFAYAAVGQLASRMPELVAGQRGIAERFFEALGREPPGVVSSVREAMGPLAQALNAVSGRGDSPTAAAIAGAPQAAGAGSGVGDGGQGGDGLLGLERILLAHVSDRRDACRSSAVQWARQVFPFDHVPARYVCILGAADVKSDIAESALQGLKAPTLPSQPPSRQQASTNGVAAPASSGSTAPPPAVGVGGGGGAKQEEERGYGAAVRWPTVEAVVGYVSLKHPQLRQPADMGEPLALQPKAFLALIRFLEDCMAHATKEEQQASEGASAVAVSASTVALVAGVAEHALIRDSSSELTRTALAALLGMVPGHRQQMVDRYCGRMPWLRSFLTHVSADVRQLAAQMMGVVVAGLQPAAAQQLLTALASVAAGGVKTTAGGRVPRFEERDGAVRALGYVLAQCRTGQPSVSEQEQASALHALRCLLDPSAPAGPQQDVQLSCSAIMALGHASLRGMPPLQPGDDVPALVALLVGALKEEKTRHASLQALAMLSHGQQLHLRRALAQASPPSSGSGDAPATTASSAQLPLSPELVALQAVVDAVLDLASAAKQHKEDTWFAAGEVLAFAFGGVDIPPEEVLHTQYESLALWHAARVAAEHKLVVGSPRGKAAPTAAVQPSAAVVAVAPPACVDTEMQDAATVDEEVLPESPSGSSAVHAQQQQLQEKLLKRLMDELCVSTKTESRAAGVIWLLSVVTYCATEPVVHAHLQDAQDMFFALLGDGSSGLVQEVAGRGLSAVYSVAGTPARRAQLLDAFVASLQGGSKRRRINVGGGSGSSSAAAKDADGGLAAYRELAALANHVGHPSLVYFLMDLASEQSTFLRGSRANAFRFPSISIMAVEQLQPHVAAMLPKLFRYQSDPQPRVREVMSHVWRALVPEPKVAVEGAFDSILADLRTEMGSRIIRVREAACTAVGDLIQGRRWSQLAPHLGQLWHMTFRALDDLSDHVRAAALILLRTLRRCSLRLCDPQQTPPSEAAQATGVVIQALLDKGVANPVVEVQAVSVGTLAELAKAAAPAQLMGHLTTLVPVMLESLSGMEDSRLNYIEQHAERLGVNADRLEGARVSAARSSPMWDTLDLCARALGVAPDEQVLASLVTRLCQLVKRGVGLNTRAGTARFVSTLLMRCPEALRPHASTLAKALLSAARSERSGSVRKAAASALAAVSKLCPEPRVAKLVEEAVALYTEADAGDVASRQLCALLCRELARGAPDVASAHARRLVPLAWVGSHDEDGEVAAAFGACWEEATSSGSSALRIYCPELCSLLVESLGSGQWGRKKAAASSISAAVDMSADALAGQAALLMDALLKELPGRLWDGKEALLKAVADLSRVPSAAPTMERQQAVIAALVEAAGKRKQSYRLAALEAMSQVLTTLAGTSSSSLPASHPPDHFAVVGPLLLVAVEQYTPQEGGAQAATRHAKQQDDDEGPPKPPPLREVVQCLTAAAPSLSPRTLRGGQQQQQGGGGGAGGPQLVEALRVAMLPAQAWAARMEACEATKALWRRVQQLEQAEEQEGDQEEISSTSGSVAGGGGMPGRAELVRWAGVLSRSAASCLEDGTHSQLRIAALEALAGPTAWLRTGGRDDARGRRVPVGGDSGEAGEAEATLACVREAVERLAGREKSSLVLAAAAGVQGALGGAVNMDAS